MNIPENWLGLPNEERDANNARIHDDHGMELRKRILFASLCLEYAAKYLRRLGDGNDAKDGPIPKGWSFNDNIDQLVEQRQMDTKAGERFHCFRNLRNAFIHDIECCTMEDFARLRPDSVSLLVELANLAKAQHEQLVIETMRERLDAGINILVHWITEDCAAMIQEQAKKMGRTLPF